MRGAAVQNRSIPQPKGVTLKGALRRLQLRLEFKLAMLTRRVTPDSVHRARAAARRLRALLQGFGAQLAPPAAHRYRCRLKRVTRHFGRLRDADVAQRNIEILATGAHGRRRKALAALSRGFRHRRERLARRLKARLSTSKWSSDVRELKKVAADVALVLPNSLPVAELARPLLAKGRRRLRKRLRRTRRSERALHRLRIQVKRLRYLLEECAKFDDELVSARELALLKGLQDCLGRFHDLVVLKMLAKRQASSRVARKELRKKCDARCEELLRRFENLRAALGRLWDSEPDADRPA